MNIFKCESCGTERIYGCEVVPDTECAVWINCEGKCGTLEKPKATLHHFSDKTHNTALIGQLRDQSMARHSWENRRL